jgi:hypothetical protein
MPVTVSDFFTMLGDAWNLPLTFAIVENEGTLLRADTQDGVSVRPANPRGLILVRCQLDILELSQTHRPN